MNEFEVLVARLALAQLGNLPPTCWTPYCARHHAPSKLP